MKNILFSKISLFADLKNVYFNKKINLLLFTYGEFLRTFSTEDKNKIRYFCFLFFSSLSFLAYIYIYMFCQKLKNLPK